MLPQHKIDHSKEFPSGNFVSGYVYEVELMHVLSNEVYRPPRPYITWREYFESTISTAPRQTPNVMHLSIEARGRSYDKRWPLPLPFRSKNVVRKIIYGYFVLLWNGVFSGAGESRKFKKSSLPTDPMAMQDTVSFEAMALVAFLGYKEKNDCLFVTRSLILVMCYSRQRMYQWG